MKTSFSFVQTTAYLVVILLLSVLLAAGAACAGNEIELPTEADVHSDNSSSESSAQHLENGKWILQSLDDGALIAGTFASLRLNGDRYEGFDGCNAFGGRNQDGSPVARPDGTFTFPSAITSSVAHCEDPEGVMDQAEAYIAALRQSRSFRSSNDSLELLDEGGQVQLVLLRQEPLPGAPEQLEGTSWRLLAEKGSGNGTQAYALTFLDAVLAKGTTVCRDFEASYRISGNSIRFPSMSMAESHTSCSQELLQREGRFTSDLSYTSEYSVYLHEGVKRLVFRTSRGKTLTFEAIPSP